MLSGQVFMLAPAISFMCKYCRLNPALWAAAHELATEMGLSQSQIMTASDSTKPMLQEVLNFLLPLYEASCPMSHTCYISSCKLTARFKDYHTSVITVSETSTPLE